LGGTVFRVSMPRKQKASIMRRNVDRDRRVVVTGLGLVTLLGTGVEKNWEALIAGCVGIEQSRVSIWQTSHHPQADEESPAGRHLVLCG